MRFNPMLIGMAALATPLATGAIAAPGSLAHVQIWRGIRGHTCSIPSPQAKATVLLFIAHDCPIANGYAPEIQRIAKAYGARGVAFDLVYVESGLTAAAARAHEAAYGYHLTALRDTKHVLVKMTGATVTPEAVVLLPSGKIAYRGRIDDKYPSLGVQRTVITEHDLSNALAAIVAGKPVPRAAVPAVGCFIPPLN